MVLDGTPVSTTLVLELAIMLRRGDFARTAELLEGCVAAGLPAAPLTRNDQEAILTVLVDPPGGLEELRAVLSREVESGRAQSL